MGDWGLGKRKPSGIISTLRLFYLLPGPIVTILLLIQSCSLRYKGASHEKANLLKGRGAKLRVPVHSDGQDG